MKQAISIFILIALTLSANPISPPPMQHRPNGVYYWSKKDGRDSTHWAKIAFHDDGKHVDFVTSDGMNCKAEEYTLDDKAQVHLTHAGDKNDCVTK
jgi:hypothetical protein